MAHLNVEIKATCADQARVRDLLRAHGATFSGTDHQIDTYFRVAHGRLKLREGTLENALIQYERADEAGPKRSAVGLFPTAPGSALKPMLSAALGVLVVVDKQREICWIENVKFHLDTVAGLGSFVEIEAIDLEGTIGAAQLEAQCRHYLNLLDIAPADLITCSYSDLLLNESRPA